MTRHCQAFTDTEQKLRSGSPNTELFSAAPATAHPDHMQLQQRLYVTGLAKSKTDTSLGKEARHD